MNAPLNLRPSSPWALCQYDPGASRQTRKGHYESFFVRANHPSEPRGFWIRYTVFQSRQGDERSTVGELWAIYFDATGESTRVVTVQQDVPMEQCSFQSGTSSLAVGGATWEKGRLKGECRLDDNRIEWDLAHQDGQGELLLLPDYLYGAPLPKAKSMVIAPNVRFRGQLSVNGGSVNVDGWQGSENHNWGSKHTDEYAWGQVAGFDNAPDAFFEVATARIKLGPIWSPPMTLGVLRLGGREYRFNTLRQAFANDGHYDYFDWRFALDNGGATLKGRIHGDRSAFTGLNYKNPPGGLHTCLNSKIASCELTLEVPGQPPVELVTRSRAAFEILTDDTGHGVEIQNPDS
ncbi:hypothetical protein QQM79_14355 [Marinobacteraceae bacterium S3BR75-40.1]